MNERIPKLRTVDKIAPPFPLNCFPKDFGKKLGREIVYVLATKSNPTLEGEEWEQIFANCIGGLWKPSNIGLDDVILGNCAWGAKTIKHNSPHNAKNVRLISGRNSPAYSFDQKNLNADPQNLGDDVLRIWNARVEDIRSKFSHVRTVVLIKSDDLSELVVYEYETTLYPLDRYLWGKNKHGNLEGYSRNDNQHRFTWQPHGSQFTILEKVPDQCMILNLKIPDKLNKDQVLELVQFDDSWIHIEYK